MPIKHLIILLLNISLCLSEVTITPSQEIVIKEGEPLKIICSASEKVDLFFPKNVPGLAETSGTSISTTFDGKLSTTVFERYKSVFGDTGWYGCVEDSKNWWKLERRDLLITPDTYDDIPIKWVYVNVESEKHLFSIDAKKYFVRAVEGQDVKFPCRPTSRDYNVTLSSSTELEKPLKPLEGTNYDPKIGFVFNNVTEEAQGIYFCETQVHDDKHERIAIHLTVEKPSSTSFAISIFNQTAEQMIVGENFSMVCGIKRYKYYDFEPLVWTTPKKTHPVGKSDHKKVDKMLHYTNKLTIEKVTEDDIGEYKCHFFGSGAVQIAKIDLQSNSQNQTDNVKDEELFNLGKANQDFKITAGSTVVMNCRASVNEFKEDISWYNSSNLLKTEGRVEIDDKKGNSLKLSQLTIKDVQKWDEGDYICKTKKNDGNTEENHYHLHVNASAAISTSVILQLTIIFLFYFM